MKSFVCFIFIGLILLQILNRSLVIISYQYNKTYIINTFCEQKDAPDNDCNAQCYLEKQTKDIDDWEGKIPNNLKNIFETPFYLNDFRFENKIKIELVAIYHNTPHKEWFPRDKMQSIFQPPQKIS